MDQSKVVTVLFGVIVVTTLNTDQKVNLLEELSLQVSNSSNASMSLDALRCPVLQVGQYSTLSLPLAQLFTNGFADEFSLLVQLRSPQRDERSVLTLLSHDSHILLQLRISAYTLTFISTQQRHYEFPVSVLSDGQWHHVAVSVSSVRLALYVDCALVESVDWVYQGMGITSEGLLLLGGIIEGFETPFEGQFRQLTFLMGDTDAGHHHCTLHPAQCGGAGFKSPRSPRTNHALEKLLLSSNDLVDLLERSKDSFLDVQVGKTDVFGQSGSRRGDGTWGPRQKGSVGRGDVFVVDEDTDLADPNLQGGHRNPQWKPSSQGPKGSREGKPEPSSKLLEENITTDKKTKDSGGRGVGLFPAKPLDDIIIDLDPGFSPKKPSVEFPHVDKTRIETPLDQEHPDSNLLREEVEWPQTPSQTAFTPTSEPPVPPVEANAHAQCPSYTGKGIWFWALMARCIGSREGPQAEWGPQERRAFPVTLAYVGLKVTGASLGLRGVQGDRGIQVPPAHLVCRPSTCGRTLLRSGLLFGKHLSTICSMLAGLGSRDPQDQLGRWEKQAHRFTQSRIGVSRAKRGWWAEQGSMGNMERMGWTVSLGCRVTLGDRDPSGIGEKAVPKEKKGTRAFLEPRAHEDILENWARRALLVYQAVPGPQGVRGFTGSEGNPGPDGEAGFDGPPGPPGTVGATGFTGRVGDQGVNGSQGELGPVGVIGPRGPQGPQGLDGESGPPGLRGIQGPMGTMGIRGEPGFEGPMGKRGPDGDKGDPGLKGERCVQGASGIQGPQGESGPSGFPGFTGLNGQPGTKGIGGENGETGPQGKLGRDGLKGNRGPDGRNGQPGHRGTKGLSGSVGITGDKGLKGFQGIAGEPGPDGRSGPLGFTGKEGVEGPQGPVGMYGFPGSMGMRGTNGHTGHRGETGVRGLSGLTGKPGPPGRLGDLGPTGLEGPQGPSGLQGSDGATGKPGPRGSRGPPGPQGSNGPAGILGMLGPSGDLGPPGLDGEQGTPGQSGLEGQTGTNGEKGSLELEVYKDSKGYKALLDQWEKRVMLDLLAMLVVQGDVGPLGPTGREGPWGTLGENGEKGPKGEKGHIGLMSQSGFMGEIGPAGLSGLQGIMGPRGPPGPDGPQGEKGESGPSRAIGPQGKTGPPGVAGLQGVRGDTGKPGPQGPVGKVGTEGDLGHKGEPGLDGEKGEPGGPGEPGEQGVDGLPGIRGPPALLGLEGPQGEVGAQGPEGPLGALGVRGNPGPEGKQGLKGEKGDDGRDGSPGKTGHIGRSVRAPSFNPFNVTV
ncbi:collagen alpha-2(I) chain-like [Oncorhynchus clarkii lewisi]|uniref:collagen alpha-2(I) chain-like n=1 Tax=Oncorhynchus clarkii lewisi TaxID=490388 RepID=UPI0039B9936B